MENSMEQKNAGLFIRFVAYSIDVMVFCVLFFGILYLLLASFENKFLVDPLGPIINILTFVIIFALLWGAIFVFYNAYLISAFGGTLGKLACGLKVRDQDSGNKLDKKTSFYRFVAGYAFSSGFFGLGFWRIIKNDENLGWHDELFGTRVQKVSSVIPGILAFVILLASLGALISLSIDVITRTIPF